MVDRRNGACDRYAVEAIRSAHLDDGLRLTLRMEQGECKLTRFAGSRREANECAEYINSLLRKP